MIKSIVHFTGLVLFFLLLGINTAYPQQQGNMFTNFKKTVTRADQYFNENSYVSAIALYKQILEKEPENNYAKIKIARAYKKINDSAEAERWFRAAIANNSYVESIDQLYFAQVLMTNGKHSEAKEWLVKYTKAKKDIRAINNLMGIEQREMFFKDSAAFKVQSAGINSGGSDFSPVFYDSLLIFLSNRERFTPVKYINTWTDQGFYDVYQSSLKNGVTSSDPATFNKVLNSKFHEGPLAFYNNGRNMIFTRSIDQKATKKVRVLGLFTAESASDNKSWKNIQALPFNHTDYSVFHPAISNDGDTLYFVSEMPGGYGGGDIYRSIMEDGHWSKPENMGSQVNTEGNELFPYLHNQTLYFSSDGHAGLGGLDIYQVELYKKALQVVNLGYPLNSTYDDFSIAWLESQSKGALASNRPHGAGSDDIYFFQRNAQADQKVIAIQGRVRDMTAKTAVDNALIYIIDEETGTDYSLRTDKTGRFTFEGIKGNSYTILADKDNKSGLISGKVVDNAEEIIGIEIWGFPPYVTIEAELKDNDSGTPIKLATVKLQKKEQVISQAQTSFSGKAVLTGNAGNEYTITISSPGYTETERNISVPETGFSDTTKIVVRLEKVRPKTTNIRGLVIDAVQKTGLPSAVVYVVNERTSEKVVLHADKEGRFSFEALVNDSYKMIAEVADNRAIIANYEVKDPAIEKNKPLSLPVYLKNQEKNMDLVTLHINMLDKKTQEGISFGVMKLFNQDTIRFLDYTNLGGELILNVDKGKEYTLKSDVIGYKESSLKFSTLGDIINDTIQLSLFVEQLEVQLVRGLAVDLISGSREDATEIYVINTSSGEEQVLFANAAGEFSFRAKEGEKVSLLAEKGTKSGVIKELILTERHFNIPLHIKLNYRSNNVNIAVHISDKSGAEIPLSQIKLKQNDIPQQLVKSDIKGKASLNVKSGQHYLLEISHAGYKTENFALETPGHSSDTLHVNVTLEKHAPELITMKGSVYIEGTKIKKPGTEIFLVNERTGESSVQKTDSIGDFEFQARIGEVYDIVGDDQQLSGMIPDLVIQGAGGDSHDKIYLPVNQLEKIRSPRADLRNDVLRKKSISQIIEENQIQFGEITGLVYDNTTGIAVVGASVEIINNKTGESYQLRSDQHGHVKFIGRIGQALTAMAETDTKVGLFPDLQINSLNEILKFGISGFPEVAVLHVQVLDNMSKKPVKLASVALMNNGNIVQQEQTQISGAVLFRVNAGEKYTIEIKDSQYEERFVDIEVPLENKTSDTVFLKLPLIKKQPQLAIVSGQVVDEVTGGGVDSVLVYVMNSKSWEVEAVQTNAKGTFNFEGYEGESYQLIGEKNFRGTNLLDVTIHGSLKPLLLKMEHAIPPRLNPIDLVYLRIDLRDKNTGIPLSGGVVKISARDTVKQTVYTDALGQKLIQVKADETYYLEGRMKDYLSSGQKVIAQVQSISDTIRVLLALEPMEREEIIVKGNTVEGSTLGALTAAKVYIENIATGEETEIISGPGGEFEFNGIVGESYTILAENAGNRGSLNKFVLRASAINVPVQVRMYPVSIPLLVKVMVRDKDSGTGISLANLSLRYLDVYQQKLVTDPRGNGIFHAQSGRNYTLEISHPAYKGQVLSAEAESAKNDTIYLDVRLEKDLPLMLAMHGHVYDVESNKPLSNANIYIINNRNQEVLEFKADERGDFSFRATEGFTYTILADNDIRSGMVTDLLISDPLKKANPFIKIPAFGILQPVTVYAQVIDEGSGDKIPGVLVKQYAKNAHIREGLTDSEGKLIWEEYKNEGYHLVVEHKNYAKRLIALEFGNSRTGDTTFLTIPLKNLRSEILVASNYSEPSNSWQFKNVRIIHNNGGTKQVFLSMDNGIFAYKHLQGKAVLDNDNKVISLAEGLSEEENLLRSLYRALAQKNLLILDTIDLQNLYYGFDKSHLSTKSMADLDKIIKVMKLHPDIQVELKAYTDSRGPANYNMVLAKRRVLSAFQYLVEQGISQTRIIQTPVGEADFIKDCSKEPCTENDHKLNRRTEMLIRYEVEMLGSN